MARVGPPQHPVVTMRPQLLFKASLQDCSWIAGKVRRMGQSRTLGSLPVVSAHGVPAGMLRLTPWTASFLLPRAPRTGGPSQWGCRGRVRVVGAEPAL